MRQVKKYITAFRLTWTRASDYRFDFIFEFICNFIPVIAITYLWQAIYLSNSSVGDYSIYQMFVYVILARFISMIITPGFFFEVISEIQSGIISNYIAKPVNYILYCFAKELGNKSKNFIVDIIPLIIVAFIYRENLILNFSLINIVFFICSFVFAYLLYFEIIMSVSMFSFWFYEISSWFYTITFMIEFFSGSIIPIDLLPAIIQNVLKFLPFKYLVYFPVTILTQNLNTNELITGFSVQVIWVVINFILVKFIWTLGSRRYDAYGG